ncbi:hypothetical protein PHJA_002143900 [Phtheirospermum japonicum]|uniref:Uncharacterized protein n=1 Tax=Phtheirospermum japonicum TaxID=374723 RepID=A0A830CQZ4_9LAMI|nr:hypothetical protein PHJA_002143900 [Phtheirospermum japonicum]
MTKLSHLHRLRLERLRPDFPAINGAVTMQNCGESSCLVRPPRGVCAATERLRGDGLIGFDTDLQSAESVYEGKTLRNLNLAKLVEKSKASTL